MGKQNTIDRIQGKNSFIQVLEIYWSINYWWK